MLEGFDMFLRCFLVSKWLQLTPSTPSLRLLSGCNPTDQCLNTTDRFCLIVPAAWTLMTLLSIEISVCGVEQIKQLHQTDFQKMCTNLK
jgi:hypothetical protein